PMMRAAAGRIVGAHPDACFLVARAPTVDAAELGDEGGPPLRIVVGRTYTVMRAADLLLVTSGTATLEAALLGTPMVVCYRLSRLSELLFKPLVRVPWISLANIALGRAVVPELYQRGLTGQALGREALRLLDSPAALAGQREAFGELAGQLGAPGVGARAARHVLELAAGRAAASWRWPRPRVRRSCRWAWPRGPRAVSAPGTASWCRRRSPGARWCSAACSRSRAMTIARTRACAWSARSRTPPTRRTRWSEHAGDLRGVRALHRAARRGRHRVRAAGRGAAPHAR